MLELQNDLDGVLNLDIDALPENPAWREILPYFIVNDMMLAAQRLAGRSEEAAITAKRALDARVNSADYLNLVELVALDRFTVRAHVNLDQKDEMREIRQSITNEDDSLVDEYLAASFVALAHLDRDRAVELLLAQKARHPEWYGTDAIAMFHMWARNVLVHPDMQAFYVDEGKWVDYLAARVPEYAHFKQ